MISPADPPHVSCALCVCVCARIHRFLWRKVHMKANVMRNWCSQVLDGLHYLHTRRPPMLHRTLHCDTVFISGNVSQVKIGALELAPLLDHFGPAELSVMPGFDAPELAHEQHAGDKVDIYAFGMTVLQMFTSVVVVALCAVPFDTFCSATTIRTRSAARRCKLRTARVAACYRQPFASCANQCTSAPRAVAS